MAHAGNRVADQVGAEPNLWVEIEGVGYHPVTVGNPHAVTFVDDPATAPVRSVGPRVEHNEAFPDDVNVEFVVVEAESLRMRVWERGVGETRACGTGAAAAVAAATSLGMSDGVAQVDLLGGRLLVELVDGSMKAQLGEPDMRLPIQIALNYPERVAGANVKTLDLVRLGELHFEPPQMRRSPALGLALKAGRMGGTYPAVLAAADEAAVAHFLDGHLRFSEIAILLDEALSAHRSAADTDLEAVLEADAWGRAYADEWVRAKV